MSDPVTERAFMEIEKECAHHACRQHAREVVGEFAFCEDHAEAARDLSSSGGGDGG